MTQVSVQLRVSSVRSVGRYGGVIFSGVTDTKEYFVAVCKKDTVSDGHFIVKGQQWQITGTLRKWKDENQIDVTCAEMLRPSGRNIIDWIARSEECAGIGSVKATKLYERFGPMLIEHIRNANVAALKEVISEDAAALLCYAFEKHKVASTLLWLDRLAIDRAIAQKIANFYKNCAQEKIEENPYRLISFSAAWIKVDDLAQRRFGIKLDDPRRLEAAVEEVLYAGMRDGHTCLPDNNVVAKLKTLLRGKILAEKAASLEQPSTQYRRVGNFLQPSGTFLIEQYVAQRLRIISNPQDSEQKFLFSPKNNDFEIIADSIAHYEVEHSITLTDEQRLAIATSATNNLSLILGGAGTGKTTVLRALYKVLTAQRHDIAIYQIALAGRAAQRMSEANGRESMTIAGFLLNVDPSMLGYGSVVVVDEMSMVDVILMHRLLRHIPPGTKLILVGDPSQLPPIGPGLVLHCLADCPSIPQTKLVVTKRQSVESGIPAVADSIRVHRIPEFAQYSGCAQGVSFVPCADSLIDATIRRIYGELGGSGNNNNVQILSTTKTGYGGAQDINAIFHKEFRCNDELFYTYDKDYGKVGAQTIDRIPLRVGDLVMYTQNDYHLGLRNGSLGIIIQGVDASSRDAVCCICEFEGNRYHLNSSQAEALRHAYSITVHKSQGSQFQRVIVPIRKSRLLDQTLIYTAVTRGVDQVVLVGNWDEACDAITGPAKSALRHINLPFFLKHDPDRLNVSTLED